MRTRSPWLAWLTALIVVTYLLSTSACDDPVPGPIGGLVLVIRSFEAASDPDLMAIKTIEIQTTRVEVQHSKISGGDASFITVDSQPRTITIQNSGQTDLLVAQYQVPVGFVSQIRIFPRAVTLHLKNGANVSLGVPSSNLPSWEQSGWKIEPTDGVPWSITQNELTGVRVLFHFDEQMLHNKGNGYKIKPTASAELFALNPIDGHPGVYADQIDVVFKEGTGIDTINSMNVEFGTTVLIAPSLSTVYRLKIPASRTLEEAYNFYHARSEVQAVLPATNYAPFASCNPTEEILPAQSLAKNPSAWMALCSANSVGSYRIRVAVIDTGINLTHPDLWMNIGIAQGEIPSDILSSYNDCDNDGVLSFYDLNYCSQPNSIIGRLPRDYSGIIGVVDAMDLIDPRNPWRNNNDDDDSGQKDDFVGYNFSETNDNPSDPVTGSQHGTRVAGIIGAVGGTPEGPTKGLAGTIWKVSLVPIRVNTFHLLEVVTQPRYFDAIKYAEKLHVDIVNISLGQHFSSQFANLGCGLKDENLTKNIAPNIFADAKFNYLDAFRQSPWYVGNRYVSKTLYVGAAGNNSLDLSSLDIRVYPIQGMKEALLGNNVMMIGSLDAPGGVNCQSSNYGTVIDLWAPGGGWTKALTADGGVQGSGGCATSFASPIVAGTAALVLTKYSELQGHPSDVRQRIINNSTNSAIFMSPCIPRMGQPPTGPSIPMLDIASSVR